MKRILSLLSIISFAAGMTSCNVDAEFSEFIPTHPLSNMVKSATATCGSETVSGTVDNSTHEIKFVFVESSNFSDVKVTLDYATRAILKDGAPEAGQQINLSNPYSFVLNNLEEDYTYTIAASRALITQVPHSQCSVMQLDNDAAYIREGTAAYKADPYFCFDGKHLSKKGAYGEVVYNNFGWTMPNPAPDGRGNSFTFDAGQAMRLSKVIFWPYWPYENQAPAVYELYAYTLPGEPAQSGEWTNWEKIADIDDSEKWQPTKAAEAGSPEDLTIYGSPVEFKYGQIPEARYYRVKMLKNFYAVYCTAMNQYWSGRVNFFSIAEVELWRYNNEE